VRRKAKAIPCCFASVLAGLVILQAEVGAGDPAKKEKRPTLAADRDRFVQFEQQLDQLRTLLKIPGLSAAVVRDQEVVWDKGFGFADREKRVPATPETPYHVASLTKTFGATLTLRLVEQGKLDLEEPVSRYYAGVKGDRIKIRHLLTHTAQGTPGERFHYAAGPYSTLTKVIEKVSGKSFRELMVATFLEPLHMDRSVPGHDMLTEADRWADRLGKDTVRRYREVLKDLARPYHLYGSDEVVANPPYRAYALDGGEGLVSIDAREGLISTVRDLARYDAALDRHQFLRRETQERAWTAAVSNGGQALPHGLGWFVQRYRGVKLVWHYGYWPYTFSALLLKVPQRNLTLILLANSDGLSAPFYDNWGVETSAFAGCFLRLFVFEDGGGRIPPDPAWSAPPQEFARQLARLRQQTDYPYTSEELSHAAMTKWLAERRARARMPIKVDPDRLAAYVGRYWLPPDRVVTVNREGDRLTIDFPGRTRFSLLPWAEGRFFLKVMDLELTFARDGKGRVSTLEIDYEGHKTNAKKVD
jgi:CubicO group peptidase (beta-lactamase class C family)